MKRIIAVECWADYYFFGRLLKNKDLIRKEKNKSEVFKGLKERVKDSFSIGIVDDDFDDLLDFTKGKIIKERIKICAELELVVFEDAPHYIIQLLPKEFENWIAKFFEHFPGASLIDFEYKNLKEFTNDSKTILERIHTNEKFKSVINYVLENYGETDNHIRKVERILSYMIENPYQIDINELKNV